MCTFCLETKLSSLDCSLAISSKRGNGTYKRNMAKIYIIFNISVDIYQNGFLWISSIRYIYHIQLSQSSGMVPEQIFWLPTSELKI